MRGEQVGVHLLKADGTRIGATSVPADRLTDGCVTGVEIYRDQPAATTTIRHADGLA